MLEKLPLLNKDIRYNNDLGTFDEKRLSHRYDI